MAVSRRTGIAALAVAGLVSAGVAAGVAGGVGVGALTGGSGAPGDPDGPRVLAAPAGPQAFGRSLLGSELAPADSCDDLLAWYVERGLQRVGPWGWEYPYFTADGVMLMPQAEMDNAGGARSGAPGSPVEEATSTATGTNVQEAGVDEPDTVKTDGTTLFRVRSGELTAYDVTGERPEELGELDLPGLADAEILLVGDHVVVISRPLGHDHHGFDEHHGTGLDGPSSRVLVVDAADAAAMRVVDDTTYDARVVAARQHGDVVRLVLGHGLPDLDFVQPRGGWRDDRSALERNRQAVRNSTLADWLPTQTRDGVTRQLLACDQVALPDDGTLGTLAVVGLRPASPDVRVAAGVATSSDLVYVSDDRLHLATSHHGDFWCCPEPLPLPGPEVGPGSFPGMGMLFEMLRRDDASDDTGDDVGGGGGSGSGSDGSGGSGGSDADVAEPPVEDLVEPALPETELRTEPELPDEPEIEPDIEIEPDVGRPTVVGGSTTLHSFALDGIGATYVASGEVDGSIADRWSMDESDDVLRVAVGPTVRTGNFNSVVTLAERGDDLVEIGRADKLGPNETIRSVRWFDDLAIVVTFRQVDPLHAVDLTDPADPVVLGELKIPGFSEYLHPIAGDLLIGVGQNADLNGIARGAQASLFDISDLTDPKQLDVVTYPRGSLAGAATDPRQFTWLPDRRTALTVVTSGWPGGGGVTGWLSVLEVDGDDLTQRLVEVDYGVEVAEVRTLPLPDGRVVLVTGDGVSFLDL
ncbi:beta-propeller domain-containing protein [Nocardioides sp. GCM10027113]|uniref:beta-propeller domain-containing protein n=1 Tax=unclassified Nocardioides TaxID=2615069 RepID=UPI00361CBE09